MDGDIHRVDSPLMKPDQTGAAHEYRGNARKRRPPVPEPRKAEPEKESPETPAGRTPGRTSNLLIDIEV